MRRRVILERERALWASYRRLQAERERLIQRGVSPSTLTEPRKPIRVAA